MSQNCWRDLSESMCFRVVSPWPGNRKHSVSIWNEEECEGGMKLSSKCKPESKRRIFPKKIIGCVIVFLFAIFLTFFVTFLICKAMIHINIPVLFIFIFQLDIMIVT